MAKSFVEVVGTLISGHELKWAKFEGHKGGSLTLEKEQRRLFNYLLNQDAKAVAAASEGLFDGLVSVWQDTDYDPATEVPLSEQGDHSGPWRLHQIETTNFGGLNTFNGPNFELTVNGENWCLEGQNGAGKTSLISAIIWTLTGKRIREQEGLGDDPGHRAPVLDDEGKQLGEWPPLVTYPPSKEDLLADATVSVRLTFHDAAGNPAYAERTVESPGIIGEPKTTINIDQRLSASSQLIETGLLMPARLPGIGFGGKSQSLYEAVKLLTGLDQLSDIAEGATNFSHGSKRFLKYAKDNGAEQLRNQFSEAIAKAIALAEQVEFELPHVMDLGADTLVDGLTEHAKKASDSAGTGLLDLEAEISQEIDVTDSQKRNLIRKSVVSARAIVDRATKGIDVFDAFTALKEANDAEGFAEFKDLLSAARENLAVALFWHNRQSADHKFRLKALASSHYHPPHQGEDDECPLCQAGLKSAQQMELAEELSELKKDAEVAERKLGDACSSLEQKLFEKMPPGLRKQFDVLAEMNPRDAFIAAVKEVYSDSEPFKDTLVGIGKTCAEVLEAQKSSLENFVFSPTTAEPKDLPSEAAKFEKLLYRMERINSLVFWWAKNGQAFRDSWGDLIGRQHEDGSWPEASIQGKLSLLEAALENVGPLDDLAVVLGRAASAAEKWAKIEEVQKTRREIATALEPLKQLRLLVAAETASSISLLADRTKEILDRIHLRERLSYENTSLEKKLVQVEGSLEEGMKINAALVANSSWLKAILWAFIFALREQTVENLGCNPFPLIVLDDPQATFDPRNKRKWAEELARIANLDRNTVEAAQLIAITHERQFFQYLVDSEHLEGQQGQIAPVNKVSKTATIVNGSVLERTWEKANSENDDALGRRYVSDVRIYCEGLIKLMLRGEGPHVAMSNLDRLGKDLAKLQSSSVAPFNRGAFVALCKTLNGGGGKPIKIINESCHQDDGTIGVAEAADVREYWMKTLQKQITDAFKVFSEFEAYQGDPRTFVWEENVASFPISVSGDVKKYELHKTGIAAAAKTDGRVGDGLLMLDEWEAAEKISLPNHEVFALCTDALNPVAAVGDMVIVSNYAEVTERSLVVVAIGEKLVARRYNRTEAHPDIAVLTGHSLNPHDLVQPIIAPISTLKPRKIVGTIFSSNALQPNLSGAQEDIEAVANMNLVQTALDGARLFQITGRSAEPIALEKQFLVTRPVFFDPHTLLDLEGRLVIAVDENGARYFKRLRVSQEVVILESLNPDGTTRPELLSLSEDGAFPRLSSLLEVQGVLFDLPI